MPLVFIKEVYKRERIVPVRFTRYIDPVPAGTYAPDLDDRGYTEPYRGPVVGVCRGDLTRVTLVREQLIDNAPLFVTSEDTSKLTIINPPPNPGQLPDGYEVSIDFRASSTNDGDVKIRIHAQALDGPIVGELTVHISQLLTVPCAVHRTAIYTPPSTRTAANTTGRTFADITNLMNEVNRMWRPCGIEFHVDTQRDNTDLTNQVARNGINPTDGALLCPVYGSGENNENFTRLMATNPVANRLNIYFVREIRTASADGRPFYVGFGSSAARGCVVSDSAADLETQAHTLAHELGHILNLSGIGHAVPEDAHADDDPQWHATVTRRRHDLWSRRRLMYYMVGLNSTDRTGRGGRYAFAGTDVGYGEGRSGHMITIKNLANDQTDNEYADARNRQASLFTP
jgi:hypothetical protein